MAPNTGNSGDVCVEESCNNLALDAAFEVAPGNAVLSSSTNGGSSSKQDDNVVIFFDWGKLRRRDRRGGNALLFCFPCCSRLSLCGHLF